MTSYKTNIDIDQEIERIKKEVERESKRKALSTNPADSEKTDRAARARDPYQEAR